MTMSRPRTRQHAASGSPVAAVSTGQHRSPGAVRLHRNRLVNALYREDTTLEEPKRRSVKVRGDGVNSTSFIGSPFGGSRSSPLRGCPEQVAGAGAGAAVRGLALAPAKSAALAEIWRGPGRDLVKDLCLAPPGRCG